MEVTVVNLMARGIWVVLASEEVRQKRLFSAMFLRGRLMKIMTCAWMLLYMVNDCLMSRSGRNDDEFLVFRSRGPICTVKFREVYLSVGDCDALRKPHKVSRVHTRLFDRSVEDSGGWSDREKRKCYSPFV